MADESYNQQYEFHDAILVSLNSHVSSKRISLILEAYRDAAARDRTAVLVEFIDVKRTTISLNVCDIRDNAISGNVNSAYLASQSYFYLNNGFIEVEAGNVKISSEGVDSARM